MGKLSVPKGTRDFLPHEMVRRNFIFDTIREVFQRYGYLPIETPAMEKLETLTGKYGEEGDKLIFSVFPRGDKSVPKGEKLKEFLQAVERVRAAVDILGVGSRDEIPIERLNPRIIQHLFEHLGLEDALRYDLTVPFARYVVQHQNDITFPFKRYQIQPVWRAERPQKGRYREFYQCDVDVIGSDSLLNEVELVQIIDEVFEALEIPVRIKINNRKILQGIAEAIGQPEKFMDMTVAIDKLDKIGLDDVLKEFTEKGFSEEAIDYCRAIFLGLSDETPRGRLTQLSSLFDKESVGVGKVGLSELRSVFDKLGNSVSIVKRVEFDVSLARGLDYYTGAIFEVVTEGFPGSLCGGGRYDDLTGIFGLPDVSGVGVSFGADRIYDVMEQNGLFKDEGAASVKVLFLNYGERESEVCLKFVQKIRNAGISAELYPDSARNQKQENKQIKYAQKKGISVVALVRKEELEDPKQLITVKDFENNERKQLTIEELINKLK